MFLFPRWVPWHRSLEGISTGCPSLLPSCVSFLPPVWNAGRLRTWSWTPFHPCCTFGWKGFFFSRKKKRWKHGDEWKKGPLVVVWGSLFKQPVKWKVRPKAVLFFFVGHGTFIFPETNIFAPEIGWLGDRSFHFGIWPMFRGENVSFREGRETFQIF